jgi:hypothetical protein
MNSENSGDIVVTPGPARLFITPYGFRRFAEDFLTASRAVTGKPDRRPPSVRFFLIYKSIELSLKAFLLTKGFELKTLAHPKKFGHRIERLYEAAVANGLRDVVSISQEQEEAIHVGKDYYLNRQFDYFDMFETITGFKGEPSLDALDSAAESLVTGLEQTVWLAVDQ